MSKAERNDSWVNTSQPASSRTDCRELRRDIQCRQQDQQDNDRRRLEHVGAIVYQSAIDSR